MYSPVIRKYWSNRPTFTDCRSLSFSTKQQERWKELFSQSEFSLFQKSVEKDMIKLEKKVILLFISIIFALKSHIKIEIRKKAGIVASNFSNNKYNQISLLAAFPEVAITSQI